MKNGIRMFLMIIFLACTAAHCQSRPNYHQVKTWFDGTKMNKSKVDGTIYIQKAGKYYRLSCGDTIYVNWFGAKADGITDDTQKIQQAINIATRLKMKRINFEGKYRLTNYVVLKSNLHYDFGKAEFFATKVRIPDNFLFYGENIRNFILDGGVFPMTSNSDNTIIGTGKYTNYCALYVKNSSDFIVKNGNFKAVYVGINVYNSNNYKITNNLLQDCNAGIANVAEEGLFSSNYEVLNNKIYSCGDDGILVGSTGGKVNQVTVNNNVVTKITRSNGELKGDKIAAVGIRAGKYGSSSQEVFVISDVAIKNNKLYDMVNHGLMLHNCKNVIISGNIIDGYAKNISTASPAIQIGELNKMGAENITLENNTIKNAYHDMPALKIADVDKMKISNNTVQVDSNTVKTKVIKLGKINNVNYSNNQGL